VRDERQARRGRQDRDERQDILDRKARNAVRARADKQARLFHNDQSEQDEMWGIGETFDSID
jgi:hypothetical protein